MNWGFTGSKRGALDMFILSHLKLLRLQPDDCVVTGACVGIDTQVFNLVTEYWPSTTQLVIVPADRSRVCYNVVESANNVVYMESETSYRDRNEMIVENCDKLVAFWTGQKAYSGTYMTINIAKTANKLFKVVNI